MIAQRSAIRPSSNRQNTMPVNETLTPEGTSPANGATCVPRHVAWTAT